MHFLLLFKKNTVCKYNMLSMGKVEEGRITYYTSPPPPPPPPGIGRDFRKYDF